MGISVHVFSERTNSRVVRATSAATALDVALGWFKASSDSELSIPTVAELAAENAVWETVFDAKAPQMDALVAELRARIAAGEATPLKISDL